MFNAQCSMIFHTFAATNNKKHLTNKYNGRLSRGEYEFVAAQEHQEELRAGNTVMDPFKPEY